MLLEVGDALLGRAHRGLADAEQPVGVGAAVLGDPAVVGVHAGVLVVEVLVVAEHHADRRVDDLAGHAVAVLLGRRASGSQPPRCRSSKSTPSTVISSAGLPAAATRPIGTGLRHAGDDEQVAGLVVVVHVRGAGRGTPGRCGRRRCRAARCVFPFEPVNDHGNPPRSSFHKPHPQFRKRIPYPILNHPCHGNRQRHRHP